MGQKSPKALNPHFKKEYRIFIEDYLFRLLGLVNDEKHRQNLIEDEAALEKDKGAIYIDDDNSICFCASRMRAFRLHLEDTEKVDPESIRLTRRVIESFYAVSRNNRTGSGKQIDSPYYKGTDKDSSLFKHTLYSFAVQKGVCGWIIDHSQSEKMEQFIELLETWAVKTYEGKKVSLGFIIDLQATSQFDNMYGNWLKFLATDNAAVLTDCIHSAIVLDKDCNYVQHISISDGDKFDECKTSCDVPLRFTQVIREHVTGSKRAGVFLLNNGDIILAKNRRVCFVKRNNKWLNFSYKAFNNALAPFRSRYSVDDALIDSVYASVLDVSFSHAGGIVAVIGLPWSSKEEVFEESVLNPCDNLLNNKTGAELYAEEQKKWTAEDREQKAEEMTKKLLKRNVMQALVEKNTFPLLDRKLRSELMALDGACILNCAGEIYSFGAIIRYDSGSTGGGRGAAAKKLSAYGMAVKISTDGYIELYINQKKVYEIK